jgi:hypothetical protein
MPQKYRKKPVVVEAFELTPRNAMQVATWCSGKAYTLENSDSAFVDIETLEGTMTAQLGDYIIKGVQGEFYPCKPDIFEATYEAAE